MIIETMARAFHMHVLIDTDSGKEEITADVVIEPSSGLLLVTAGGIAASARWAHPIQWGTATFEEFLCQRTPSWITGKMLGDEAIIFDPKRTYEGLLSACGEMHRENIIEFLRHVDDCGDIRETGQEISQVLQDDLEEPIDGWIMMAPTFFAQILVQAIIPALQERIAPPPVVRDQTHLKLC